MGRKGEDQAVLSTYVNRKIAQEKTISELELRNSHGHSLRIAVTDADGDRLNTGLLGGGGGGTVQLKEG